MESLTLRVALITDTYAPAVNGVVRSVQTAKEGLERLGVHVHVFAPGTRSVARASVEKNVDYFPAIETNVYPKLHVSVLPLRARHLRGFDLVHVHTPGPLGIAGMVAAKRLGIPYIYTYHTRFNEVIDYLARFESAERLIAALAGHLERGIIKGARAVVAPTPAIAAELEANHRIQPHVLPTGVDLDEFRPAARVVASAEGPRFLHLGRLAREKNVETVLRAMPHVLKEEPRAKLTIGGAGPDGERVKRLARDLGLEASVQFLGFVHERDLPSVYQQADVYVSASRFETQGLTVLEALACGVPAALADVAVFRPLAEQGAALLFDAQDPQAVARSMLAAYNDRAEMARAGLRVAAQSSTREVARRLHALYAGLAEQRAPLASPM